MNTNFDDPNEIQLPITSTFLGAIESTADFIRALENAQERFVSLGLTRNYYVKDKGAYAILRRKVLEIPVTLFMMHPRCLSRIDRYRIEPIDAFLRGTETTFQVLQAYGDLIDYANANRRHEHPEAGLRIYFFDFPCSFSIEIIDRDICRVQLYGYGNRGVDGPLLVFRAGTPYFQFFEDQINWVQGFASDNPPLLFKNVHVFEWDGRDLDLPAPFHPEVPST